MTAISELKWNPEKGIPSELQINHAKNTAAWWQSQPGEEAAKNAKDWLNKLKEMDFLLGKRDELSTQLDSLYPNARSRKIATHNGHRFCKRYFPIELERGRVTWWGRYWEDLGPVVPRRRKSA